MTDKNIKPIYEVMTKKKWYFIEECHLLIPVFIQALVLGIAFTLSPFPHYLKLNLTKVLALIKADVCARRMIDLNYLTKKSNIKCTFPLFHAAS